MSIKRIVFVDDEPFFLDIVRLAFKKEVIRNKMELELLDNGLDCFHICKNLKDKGEDTVIFTDLNMPKLDGFSLMKRLSEIGFKGKVYIVSSYDRKDYIEKAFSLGCTEFFPKPLNISYLKEVVLNEIRTNTAV